MFADDVKSFRVIINGEDYTASQNDLNLLHRCSQQWQLNLTFQMQASSLWPSSP